MKKELNYFWKIPQAQILKELDTQIEGLKDEDVKARKKIYPANTPPGLNPISPLKILLRQFNSPLIIILIGISLFSFYVSETIEALIIVFMLTVNITISYLQELKAEKSLNRLKKLLVFESRVLRNGEVTKIKTTQLVPGDIVKLNMGDTIPADLVILDSQRLEVNEAVLTGESLPIAKDLGYKKLENIQPQKIKHGLFMGCSIVSGSATAVVVYTGVDTFIGKTIDHSKLEIETNFQKSIAGFSKLLLIFVVILTSAIFLVNIAMGREPITAFLFGITLALGITPEALPIIITIAIAGSALRLTKKGVLVRRLSAVEDIGNMDVLCSDKTGTITKGELKLVDIIAFAAEKKTELKNYALLCNSYNPKLNGNMFQNPLDRAIFNFGKNDLKEVNDYKLLDYIDFDFQLKLMQVLVNREGENIQIVKGAYDSIKNYCSSYLGPEGVKKFDNEKDQVFKEQVVDLEAKGFRVIALAYKDTKEDKIGAKLEGLSLIGFLSFYDPPKGDLNKTFARLANLNVSLKIISGDGAEITREICLQGGMEVLNNRVITSDDLEGLNDKEKTKLISQHNVFARINPVQKQEIIKLIKEQGHVVGYFGDGVNDVGALKTADVALSVHDATDVAKDCADLILLKTDISAIINSVVEGRKTFSNTIKFIINTMSSSYGNVLTIAFSSFFMKFVPLLPSQVLFIDTISDFQHLTISSDNVDEEMLKKPRKWDSRFFIKFMLFFGVISTVFDLILIFTLLGMQISIALFRNIWVVESILTELLATFSIRTRRVFFKSKPSPYVILTSLISAVVAIIIPYTLIGNEFFEFEAISLQMLLFIAGIVLCYFIILEIAKRIFYRYIHAQDQ
jgi:Mg2+-importing ATPase